MHELSLMQEILKVIEEQVRVNEVRKVHEVHLKVGKMMAVVPSSLSFCFEILSKGTMLEAPNWRLKKSR